jgi:hypothetical protein
MRTVLKIRIYSVQNNIINNKCRYHRNNIHSLVLQSTETERHLWYTTLFFSLALQPSWALAAFQSPDLYKIGRTPWTCDQPVARLLPKHRIAQTQNKHIYYTININALSGIRTHDHSIRVSEDSSCLKVLGYHDRHTTL